MSKAFGGKIFPKLFVKRDIEFYSQKIEAFTVSDSVYEVEYMPQHDAVEAFDDLLAMHKNLLNAAIQLRKAQRLYMENRGNETLGKNVGNAAAVLDEAINKLGPYL